MYGQLGYFNLAERVLHFDIETWRKRVTNWAYSLKLKAFEIDRLCLCIKKTACAVFKSIQEPLL